MPRKTADTATVETPVEESNMNDTADTATESDLPAPFVFTIGNPSVTETGSMFIPVTRLDQTIDVDPASLPAWAQRQLTYYGLKQLMSDRTNSKDPTTNYRRLTALLQTLADGGNLIAETRPSSGGGQRANVDATMNALAKSLHGEINVLTGGAIKLKHVKAHLAQDDTGESLMREVYNLLEKVYDHTKATAFIQKHWHRVHSVPADDEL